ncbi:hypothetical protein [Akkermansia muciniphila]|uniref:hypothetical protein n=2 Tax=Akkermansia muciniphila TaxID=239935 RepID=UPI00319DC37D
MPDEGPLEHYLTVSHEPEPDIPEPAPERSPGPWRERGIMLGLGFLLGCIGAYALVYSEMSGGMRSLKQSLSEERDLNASLQKERAHLRETLEQARMDALLEERSPLSVTVGGVSRTSRRPVPQPPPLTPLSSGGLASPSSAPVPGSLDDRLVNPGPEDWKERYQYAALKYNQVVEDYNRLKKLYMNLVGRSGAAGGLVTGAQFYKALRKDTRAEARKLDECYMKGGMRGSELRELERSRDEMRHRDWWLKKMARQFQID